MAECPFCKGAISEDLASYGGRCPSCLIEIPGEEAPTNPGVDAQARQAVEAQAAKASKRNRVVFAAATLVLLGVTGGGAALFFGASAVVSDGGDDFEDFVMVPLDRHEDLDVPEEENPEEIAAVNPGASNLPTSSSGSSSASTSSSSSSTSSSSEGSSQEASILGTGVKTTPSGSKLSLDLGSGPTVAVASKGPEAITLTDSEEIRKMIQTVLKAGGSSLKSCYEAELKSGADLGGTWDIEFSLDDSGKAKAIEIIPRSSPNPQLEACMKSRVAGWSFQRIAQPTRIVKPFSFETGW